MDWVAWFPDTALKGIALLAAAWFATRLLQRQPAALRHLVWVVTLGGLLAMPVLSATSPLELSLPVSLPARVVPQQTTVKRSSNDVTTRARESAAPVIAATREPRTVDEATPGTLTDRFPSWSLAQWAIVAWMLGVAALAVRFIAGVVVTRRLRHSAITADASFADALAQSAERAGLGAVPRLIITDHLTIPCAFGWLRPTIVLPIAARAWSRDRLDVVLLHEATHIRRGDYATHLVAELARIVHWYNPLVWVASRALRAEAERATDERVINAGATASDYAGHLLDIVRSAGAQRIPAPLLPLAMRTEFEGRLIAILEHAGARQLRTRTAAFTLVAGVALAGTVASIGATEPASAATEPPTVAPPAQQLQSDAELERAISTVRALLDAIEDSVPSVRLAVVSALSTTRDTVVIRELMRVLRDDENADVRRAAAHSLGELEDALAVPALTDALLRDRDVEVRRNAASALGSIESELGAGALAQALESDADLEVRINAAEALSDIPGATATNALSRALSRATEPKLKVTVIEALDSQEDSRSTPALIAALRDSNAGVRAAAASALDGVEDASAMTALIAVARDDDVEVRKAVIEALNDFDDQRLVDVFAHALTDRDAEIRAAAANGLGNIEDLRTAPRQLVAALDDADAEVRQEVVHALGHIQDRATLDALIAKLNDADADVRLSIVEAISEFGDVSVTAALQRALRDSNAEVRRSAAEALGERRKR